MSQPRSARRSGANAAAHLKPELVVAPFGYERARDLPKLLPLWEWELASPSEAEHARLLARLRRALRAERLRGLSGHWTYEPRSALEGIPGGGCGVFARAGLASARALSVNERLTT